MQSSPNPQAVKAFLLDLQDRIVAALEALDGKPFLRDEWERPEGGGGISRLVEEGNVIERGGVNFSHVMGARLPPSASACLLYTSPSPRDGLLSRMPSSA